jgi:hypothetical protein
LSRTANRKEKKKKKKKKLLPTSMPASNQRHSESHGPLKKQIEPRNTKSDGESCALLIFDTKSRFFLLHPFNSFCSVRVVRFKSFACRFERCFGFFSFFSFWVDRVPAKEAVLFVEAIDCAEGQKNAFEA